MNTARTLQSAERNITDRSTLILLIAIALGAYGVYVAAHLPAMLIGPPELLLLLCFVVQTVCAFAAAIGVWRGSPWAAAVVLALGVSVAVTWLIEAFVLGIVAWLYALLAAVLAIVIAILVATYIGRTGGIARAGRVA